MAPKMIWINDELYERLNKLKNENESFSQLIERVISSNLPKESISMISELV